MEHQEYILCAAIKRIEPKKDIRPYHNNDITNIEIGYRHHDILQRFKGEVSQKLSDQGFYTSKGRFVDRIEAMKIAVESEQVRPYVAYKYYSKNTKTEFNPLYSEDLY